MAVAFSVVAVVDGLLLLIGVGAGSAFPQVVRGGSTIVLDVPATTHGASYARARRTGGGSG